MKSTCEKLADELKSSNKNEKAFDEYIDMFEDYVAAFKH